MKVSYVDSGPKDAQAILFIHGFPLNKTMWNMQLNALKSNYRTIAYDVRGHGDSAIGSEDFSIELFVKDLIDFLDALKIEKIMLCGLSMGGYIALNAVLNHPSRFDGLILCDTNCAADSPETVEKRMNTIENIKNEGIEKYANESVKNLFAPSSFQTKTSEIKEAGDMIMGTSQLAIFRTLHALASRKETCSRLSEIKTPTLILVGKEDKITPPETAKVIHEGIDGAKLFILDDAGHLSNMENPTQFNKHISDFISQMKRAPQEEKSRV